MDKKYETSIHRTGRIGVIIAIVFMLGIPTILSAVYDVWPESIGQIFAVGGGLLAVFLPTNIAEVLSYTPHPGILRLLNLFNRKRHESEDTGGYQCAGADRYLSGDG